MYKSQKKKKLPLWLVLWCIICPRQGNFEGITNTRMMPMFWSRCMQWMSADRRALPSTLHASQTRQRMATDSRAARIELALHQACGERGQQSGAGHERPEVRSTGDVTLYCTVRLVHSVTSHSPTVHASYSCDSCWISLIQMIQLSKSAMPYKSLLLTKAVQLWKIFHCFL